MREAQLNDISKCLKKKRAKGYTVPKKDWLLTERGPACERIEEYINDNYGNFPTIEDVGIYELFAKQNEKGAPFSSKYRKINLNTVGLFDHDLGPHVLSPTYYQHSNRVSNCYLPEWASNVLPAQPSYKKRGVTYTKLTIPTFENQVLPALTPLGRQGLTIFFSLALDWKCSVGDLIMATFAISK